MIMRGTSKFGAHQARRLQGHQTDQQPDQDLVKSGEKPDLGACHEETRSAHTGLIRPKTGSGFDLAKKDLTRAAQYPKFSNESDSKLSWLFFKMIDRND